MIFIRRMSASLFLFAAVVLSLFSAAYAQNGASESVITNADELKKIVPSSFYFAGQSAETQMRNAAAAKLAENRYIIAGLVDTSGYSTEISGKYEGFFITDSKVKFGNKILNTGAYGIGFSADGNVNIFDLGSRQVLSVKTTSDEEMKRPRPLTMANDKNGVRLYKGKNYVLISLK